MRVVIVAILAALWACKAGDDAARRRASQGNAAAGKTGASYLNLDWRLMHGLEVFSQLKPLYKEP